MMTPQPIPLGQAKNPKLLDQALDKIRLNHYSLRITGHWVQREDWVALFANQHLLHQLWVNDKAVNPTHATVIWILAFHAGMALLQLYNQEKS